MNLRKLWAGILVVAIFVACYLIYYFDIFESKRDLTPILLREIPEDHPYRPFLEMDNETHFLDSDVKDFLAKSHKTAFPTRYNQVFLDTLLEFDRVWRQELNRSYMLYAGTLLGAIRHGDRTPWDDDLDIMVDIKYNKSVRSDLNFTSFFIKRGGPFRKVFFTNNRTTTNKYGHWPFIDLFFYQLNGTKMRVCPYPIEYDTNDVFPPSEISYMGRKFPAPRCSKRFVQQSIDRHYLQNCCNYGYNHRLDISTPVRCVPCSKLHGFFQFAKYRRINKTHEQQLLSEPLPPWNIPHMKQVGEEWRKGAILRQPMC